MVDNIGGLTDPLMNKYSFMTRRRMAWVSLGSMIILIIYSVVFIDSTKIAAYATLFNWAFTVFGGIVLGYMGTASWSYNNYCKAAGTNNILNNIQMKNDLEKRNAVE